MPRISVKAKKGRVAYDAPRGGRRIPEDRFVSVDETPYIMRLLDHHGDIVQESKATPATAPAKAVKAEAKPDSAPAA